VTTVLTVCPNCKAPLANHCLQDGQATSACNWFRCTNGACRAYGTFDGSRWATGVGPK
jgi:hypothetical protein